MIVVDINHVVICPCWSFIDSCRLLWVWVWRVAMIGGCIERSIVVNIVVVCIVAVNIVVVNIVVNTVANIVAVNIVS